MSEMAGARSVEPLGCGAAWVVAHRRMWKLLKGERCIGVSVLRASGARGALMWGSRPPDGAATEDYAGRCSLAQRAATQAGSGWMQGRAHASARRVAWPGDWVSRSTRIGATGARKPPAGRQRAWEDGHQARLPVYRIY